MKKSEIRELVEAEINHLSKSEKIDRFRVDIIINNMKKIKDQDDKIKDIIENLEKRSKYIVKTTFVAYLHKAYIWLLLSP